MRREKEALPILSNEQFNRKIEGLLFGGDSNINYLVVWFKSLSKGYAHIFYI